MAKDAEEPTGTSGQPQPDPCRISTPGELAERRKHARFDVSLAVWVRVLVEEQTFSPFQFQGTCDNLSLSGAMVSVPNLPKETYLLLIRRQRFVRLMAEVPGQEQPLTLFGKLAWFDYQEEGDRVVCRLAVAFEPMKDEVNAVLKSYLESVGASESSPGL